MMTKPAALSFPVSNNVSRMQPSSTLAAMQAAEALRAAGANVVDFGAGEPDFDTPDNIKQAAVEAMRAGQTKYTPTAGTRQLQQAIIDFYAREFRAEYERPQVMATSGGKQAVFNAVVTLINPGDEVLMAKPYWVTFPEIVVFAGGIPVFIETEDTGFLLNADQIEQAITPRTKLIILNSPSNPSGRVIPPAEFKRIMELLTERGIYVISDECYLRFVYPPAAGVQRSHTPAGTSEPSLHRRLVLKNLRHDGLAHGLHASTARVDPGDAEGSKPLDEQSQFHCSASSGRGFQWTTRVCGRDAG